MNSELAAAMPCARRLPFYKVRSRTIKQFLLVLCLVSLIGLFVSHKNRIINGVYPDQKEHRRLKEFEYYSSEDDTNDEMPPTTEVNSVNLTTKPVLLTTKPILLTTKPILLTTKPILLTTKSILLTTKQPNASTTQRTTTIKPLTSKATTRQTTIKMNATTSQKPQTPTRKVITTYNFGDTYAIDDMHVKSKCPNRTRDNFQNSENLQKLFLETVPVLQWKKHAQESEYERLRKFSGAQGWMGVTWQILNETLNLMNSTGNGYMFDTWNGSSPCIRCAVVGNGGILNGSRMGTEIDSHDYIFRVNGAITDGFEEDVGRRTSFYFFGTNTLMNSLVAYRKQGFKTVPRTEETRFVLLPDHDRDYLLVRAALTNGTIDQGRDKGRYPARYFGKNLTTEHFKILHPDFMRYLRNRFLWTPILNTKNRDIYRPSTGASILLAAIHTCDQVSAYGYMTPSYKKFSDHYYDAKFNKVVFYSNHNYLKEMKLWQDLHKAGVITLYMRD
ncbi:alpha-N-acetylgalactosaminide alpha-2,6-sialyltransferase 2-like [Mantella aurantiaca]